MTEQCNHKWEWFKYDGHYHCQVSGCDEKRHPIKMEPNINATERLSVELVIQNIIIYGEGGFVTDRFLSALKAYADALAR